MSPLDTSLIDRLGAASLEAKDVVRELHAATKDARAVLKEVSAERERVEAMVRRSVEAEIEEAVKKELEQVAAECASLLDAASRKVLADWGKFELALWTGGTKRRGASDLRDLAR